MTNTAYSALDEGYLPDFLVRRAIRYLTNQRIKDISSSSMTSAVDDKCKYIDELKQSEIAIEQAKANEQHYEVSYFIFSLT